MAGYGWMDGEGCRGRMDGWMESLGCNMTADEEGWMNEWMCEFLQMDFHYW
jgi:hypothetical protein